MTPEQRRLLSDPNFTDGWPDEYAEALEAALHDSSRLEALRTALQTLGDGIERFLRTLNQSD